MSSGSEFFDGEEVRRESEAALVVDVGGFEGPLDLLLDLARRQKVDLHEISILALAEQYLAFVETARSLRLELAADYLVMAAWLAYLKSRLLLPAAPKAEGPDAAELAAALALRLRRLDAIREAARLLGERPQLGREVFGRGGREPRPEVGPIRYEARLFDLLDAYAAQRQRRMEVRVTLKARRVWSLAEARAALERLIGPVGDWLDLQAQVLRFLPDPELGRTALASTLSAALELVREGRASLRQDGAFGPLLVKAARPAETAAARPALRVVA